MEILIQEIVSVLSTLIISIEILKWTSSPTQNYTKFLDWWNKFEFVSLSRLQRQNCTKIPRMHHEITRSIMSGKNMALKVSNKRKPD